MCWRSMWTKLPQKRRLVSCRKSFLELSKCTGRKRPEFLEAQRPKSRTKPLLPHSRNRFFTLALFFLDVSQDLTPLQIISVFELFCLSKKIFCIVCSLDAKTYRIYLPFLFIVSKKNPSALLHLIFNFKYSENTPRQG
jgi:hypothetical protein